jgi:hypothetical protein
MTYLQRYYRGLGWRCAVLRQRARLDQREAAQMAGISLAAWRRVEAGRQCRTATYYKIAFAFPDRLTWLFTGKQAA